MTTKITLEDLVALGWRQGPIIGSAIKLFKEAAKRGVSKNDFLDSLRSWDDGVRLEPQTKTEARLAAEVSAWMAKNKPSVLPGGGHGEQAILDAPCPYKVWGAKGIDGETLKQMNAICRVPPAAMGALMPDAHVGYSMPIGGVLAMRDAVMPAAVGVDIACRMKLTVTSLPWERFAGRADRFRKALLDETRFGLNAHFDDKVRRDHEVMEDPRWGDLPGFLRAKKQQAWAQLGSSGGGNHFVEWGTFVLDAGDVEEASRLGFGELEAGRAYVALLSHSGSRGLGARTADHFVDLAQENSRLPKAWRHLAWFDLASDLGQQYWTAMNLCGDYASANHATIHQTVLKAAGLGKDVAATVENHHNFAWRETHGGEDLVVHRKGATPAGEGVLGVIPGSMADPGFVVVGTGNEASLASASHGAGRKMSRKGARERLSPGEWRAYLAERGVELNGGGIDEAPMAYKDIREVMATQGDLARPIGRFDPKMVRMAGDDEGSPRSRRLAKSGLPGED
jgi:tRNA-splicing ligase RtcB